MQLKITQKKLWIDYVPMALTAILILTFAIINKQTFFKTLPTIVTLFVQILLVRANRFAFLIGGINAAIYGIVYFSDALYFSATSAVLISFPIQIYSFFHWSSKQTAHNHTELKRFDLKKWVLYLSLILAGWLACYFGLARFFASARLPILDTYGFASGIVVSLLAARRYVESQYLNLIACTLHIVMWTIICISNPSNVNYLIISFYNLFMISKAAIHWAGQYKADQQAKRQQVSEEVTLSL